MHSLYEILTEYPHNKHYLLRYIKFIEYCKQSNKDKNLAYTEKHHICMSSMFPELSCFKEFPWNCAILTARQHYIAHLILWKCYRNRQSAFAFHIMAHGNSNGKRYSIRLSRVYENLLKDCKMLNSGPNHPLFGTKRTEESKINQKLAVTGKKQSEDHIKKRTSAMLATKQKNKENGVSYELSDATKQKISEATLGKAKPMTDEHKANLKCHTNNTTTVICPHCSKMGQLTNMKRWHFDKCKDNPNRVTVKAKTCTCEFCGHSQVASPNFYRYHGSNCSKKPTSTAPDSIYRTGGNRC